MAVIGRLLPVALAALLVACGSSSSDGGQAGGSALSSNDPSQAQPQTAGWVGVYETETTHRAWAIRITNDHPFTFELVAGHLEDTTEFADATALVAAGPAGESDLSMLTKATMIKGDCTLQFTKVDFGVNISQTGLCTSIGLPSSDDLSIGQSDFTALDESKECFDKKELAVREGGTCSQQL